jgi:capsular exopolysaccharide synthesis family protein
MNQDYQLSTNPQAAGDFWTQNGTNLLANAGIGNGPGPSAPLPPKPSPMKKAHRLLRGRYPLVILLAAIGAIGGGTAGYMALPPKYESTGLIAINPMKASTGLGDQVIPMFTVFVQMQVGLISSSGVASTALQDPKFIAAWQQDYGSTPLPTVAEFISAITVEHKGNTSLITVSFDDHKKEVAEAGAKAVISAYFQQHGAGDEFGMKTNTINFDKKEVTALEGKLNDCQQQLAFLAKQYGTTDFTVRITALQESLSSHELELAQVQSDYDRAVASRDDKSIKRKIDPEVLYQQIGGVDRGMAVLLAERDAANSAKLDVVSEGYMPKSLPYQHADQRLKDTQERVAEYSNDFMIRAQNANLPEALQEALAPDLKVEILKNRAEQLQKLIKDQNAIAADVGSVAQQVETIRELKERLNAKIQSDQNTITTLESELFLTQSVVIKDPGGEAVLASDKRKLVAGLGFGFGGLIPLGLILLYGLTENRFRFSDDASAADLSGVTLLGILPNLPDRLSDPQQAGIAAHCVHQIRTMLQISRSNDEPQVIAVTSASSGDGKTSLTLALGLSYAACGARTLLIDCDLIAAGLTHRLNVSSADGILESVANRALLEYVRTTDIADVAVLPVGTTHAHHASTLSPVALRRLLSEAKKHFDLIIVDTGPILGSIEASLVCAAADRTILAVARNQQRPLVEKSIAHLQNIGAQLAGVVFNRAQARDFERSMSGLALRSRPLPGSMNATPGQTTAAKAVAGSFKRAG